MFGVSQYAINVGEIEQGNALCFHNCPIVPILTPLIKSDTITQTWVGTTTNPMPNGNLMPNLVPL